ncbi:MAG: hypothetical protein RI972_298 [Pseudomonadota bacterium]|jgi:hypothetical protein
MLIEEESLIEAWHRRRPALRLSQGTTGPAWSAAWLGRLTAPGSALIGHQGGDFNLHLGLLFHQA